MKRRHFALPLFFLAFAAHAAVAPAEPPATTPATSAAKTPAQSAAKTPAKSAAKTPAKSSAKKKAPPKPTTAELIRQLAEQRALIDAQTLLIQQQEATLAEQATKIHENEATGEKQAAQLTELQAQLAAMQQRLDEIQQEIPGAVDKESLEERLKRIEAAAEKAPELPPNVVSAGDFPGSIRIPGTDGAIKFGGRVRAAAVFTLAPLGSTDRFVTNSIPVEPGDEAAGQGTRTTFSANTSRINFESRTPAGASQLRTFIEGDFFGTNGSDSRTNFRLRHAYAQFHGMIAGQTWSTFSDPAADHQDMDFEGINGENVIRQPQFRYTWFVREGLSVAAAMETPEVSLTGGQGVNLIPDLVGRAIWKVKDVGHLQGSVVLRQIRGQSDTPPGDVSVVPAWGASLSGVLPFHKFNLLDRFIFQLNLGQGIARYINDLSSLGGQDGVFDPATGTLHALGAVGGYIDYEHQWKEWAATRVMKLRSSFIWSFVSVENLAFQPDDAYRQTNRYSVNVVFSPTDRIDVGAEYIYGTRENKDTHKASSAQFQIVSIFRF